MNFVTAILHAGIGYGIRRKRWVEGRYMFINAMHLYWCCQWTGMKNVEVKIMGGSGTYDLYGEDIRGEDWETI